MRQDSETEPFACAIALTSPVGYKNPTEEAVDDTMEFSMLYLIQGDEEQDDGKQFKIGFKKCTDKDWKKFHLKENNTSERLKTSIDSHIEHDTFWCPDAFDLSFWGMKGDLDSKTLTMDFKASQAEKLDGKSLLLLISNKKAVYQEDADQSETAVKIKPFTSMHWLPLSASAP